MTNCCVFGPANVCLASRLLVEIIFSALEQVFLYFPSQMEKRGERAIIWHQEWHLYLLSQAELIINLVTH